ncbi:MAG: immunoglobulin-like domain-containing protein [Faecousia sp.]
MRNLQIVVITVFLIVSIIFSVFFCYDRLAVDHTAPQIISDGVPLYVSVNATDKELCSGLIAYDNVDGDISDRIIVRRVSRLSGANSAYVYYAVFDSSSNYCVFNRTIYYTDYCKPRFSLSQPLNFTANSIITLEDRLSAYDVIDGDISNRIRLSSVSVSNTEPGEYPITVQVTNNSGDTSSITLTVLIENTTSRHPTITLSEYIYYATYGEELTEETLRSLIVGASESSAGKAVDAADIEISGEVDTTTRGSYSVTYSYTNAQGLTHAVILNVIVE